MNDREVRIKFAPSSSLEGGASRGPQGRPMPDGHGTPSQCPRVFSGQHAGADFQQLPLELMALTRPGLWVDEEMGNVAEIKKIEFSQNRKLWMVTYRIDDQPHDWMIDAEFFLEFFTKIGG